MDLKLINGEEARGDDRRVSTIFARDYNEPLIHQLVTAYQANARSGNRKQKGRADVNKSHRKPWAQKGTGRRTRGPGHSVARRRQDLPELTRRVLKVNRKMYRAGVAAILSQLVREGRLR